MFNLPKPYQGGAEDGVSPTFAALHSGVARPKQCALTEPHIRETVLGVTGSNAGEGVLFLTGLMAEA